MLIPKDLEDTASIESEGAGMALFDGLSNAKFLGLDSWIKGLHILGLL